MVQHPGFGSPIFEVQNQCLTVALGLCKLHSTEEKKKERDLEKKEEKKENKIKQKEVNNHTRNRQTKSCEKWSKK